ncbi:MAG: hypothetical protein LBD04_06060 [Synergistaceae bacterium]|nr:hypothetical protein [Synergistaceae bacterium]
MITVKALRAIRRADLVFVPVAAPGRSSAAESVIRAHADVEAVPVVFPMTRDAAKRDAAALYKPSALGEKLRSVVESAGPWREILRTDRAGLPEERLVEGIAALSCPDEYPSTLLLRRRSR